MDGGAWQPTVHGIARSRTRLSNFISDDGQQLLQQSILKLRHLHCFSFRHVFLLNIFYLLLRVCVCVHAQLCLTLCDLMDCSLPGSSVRGILQTRILEWVAISFSRGDLPKPGIKHRSPALQADSLPSEPPGSHLSSTWKQTDMPNKSKKMFSQYTGHCIKPH